MRFTVCLNIDDLQLSIWTVVTSSFFGFHKIRLYKGTSFLTLDSIRMPYTSSEVTTTRRPSIYATTPSYSGTSTYRSSPSYLGSSASSYLTSSRTNSIISHTRSSSLDRSVSRDVSTYRPPYHHHHHLASTPVRSATLSSRPPRSTSFLDTTTVNNNIARKLDNDLKSRLARLDFGPNFGRSSSLRNSITAKSSCDAIHDHITSPVLTNYRHLGDTTHVSSAVSRRSYDHKSDLDNRLGLKRPSSGDVGGGSIYSSAANLLDSDSGISTSSSSSGSSSPSLSTGSSRSRSKLSLDENSNRTYSRYPQYDSNHNLYSVKNNEDDEGAKSNGDRSPSLRHSRYGSNDDVASFSSYGRHRRTSGQASTSGYSSVSMHCRSLTWYLYFKIADIVTFQRRLHWSVQTLVAMVGPQLKIAAALSLVCSLWSYWRFSLAVLFFTNGRIHF